MINGEKQVLKSKTITCVRPDDVHYFCENEDESEKLEYFNIIVPTEFMKKQFLHCPELKNRIYKSNVSTCIRVKSTEFGVICGRALAVSEMQTSAKKNKEFEQKHTYLYYALVKELCACMLEYDVTEEKRASDWFAKLLSEIEELPIDELSYEWMLSFSGVSQNQLWRAFNKNLNLSPIRYINKKKIQTAYEMVVIGNKKITDIAFDVGYNSYTHFLREFNRYFNCSPLELRKKDNGLKIL